MSDRGFEIISGLFLLSVVLTMVSSLGLALLTVLIGIPGKWIAFGLIPIGISGLCIVVYLVWLALKLGIRLLSGKVEIDKEFKTDE